MTEETENTIDETKEPRRIETSLRALVDSYVAAQKNRVAWENRERAEAQGADLPPTPKIEQARKYTGLFRELETAVLRDIAQELKTYAVYKDWLRGVKGIGPTLAAKLLNEIDFARAQHVSSLWKFAGLAPGQRLKKGEKASYNTRLKTTCFLVARSFLMTSKVKEPSPYLKFYVEAKQRYAQREGWTKMHVELAARRYMVKMFLSHFWVKGRESLNLPVTEPYAFKQLDHDREGYVGPDEMTA